MPAEAAGGDVQASLIAADGNGLFATRGGLFSPLAPAGPPDRSPGRRAGAASLRRPGRRGGGGAQRNLAGAGRRLAARVVKGEAWSAAARADGSVVVALRDQGLLVSADSRNGPIRWAPRPPPACLPALPPNPHPGPSLIDLHTGKALFGKDGEWLWIDAVAGSLPVSGRDRCPICGGATGVNASRGSCRRAWQSGKP